MAETKRIQAPKKPRADATRNYQTILAAAKKVAAQKGAELSLEEVARQAHVGIGTIYRHFPTKLELSAAIYNDQLEDLLKRLKLVPKGADSGEGLLAWLGEVAERMITYSGLVSCFDMAKSSRPDSEFWKWKTELIKVGTEVLSAAQKGARFRAGLSIGELLGLVDALVLASSHSPRARATLRRWLAVMGEGLRP
jgi:AcrR family transcriptional regulator